MPRSVSQYPTSTRSRIIILSLVLVIAGAARARAIEPAFRYVRFDGGRLQTCLALADSLPAELIGYIDKGVPVSAEYTIELWRARPGWFDALAGRATVKYKIRFDPWEKEYTVVRGTAELSIENILDEGDEAIELLSSSGPVVLAPADSLERYYLAGSLVIRVMSFSNFREVESWLKGEVSDIGKPNLEDAPDRVGEFLFNVALKVSGLKDYSGDTKTDIFTLERLPNADSALGN